MAKKRNNPDSLELSKMKRGEEITSEYYEMEVGESVRIAVIGAASVRNTEGRDVPAIKFMDEEGSVFVNADAVICSTLKDAAELAKETGEPQCFEVECTGTQQSKKGTYKTFRIYPLY